MNAVIEDTQYLTETKFSNAVRKAGVRLNTKTGFQSSTKLSIGMKLNADGLVSWDRHDEVLFSFYGLTVTDAQKLHAAGFEVRFIQERNMGDRNRVDTIAYYSKSAK